MNYQQTINYLFTKLPMFSRIGSAAFKKDLTNISILCEYLDNPHQKFKSVHIGGTNGKGSVSHMLAAILQTAGYKTGLYTSPHLYDFRERIKISGIVVEEDFVIHFIEKIQPLIEKIEPSFFEITVAMAFAYFAEQKVDIAIMEVGLGGRLDSTNIISPDLSVITNISWDHMNLLGNSLESIAREKAGIIKPNIPIVIGEKQEETKELFLQVAQQQKAPLYFATDQFETKKYEWQKDLLNTQVWDKTTNKEVSYLLDLPGIYQTKNISTVLKSVSLLRQKGFTIKNNDIKTSLCQIKKLTGLHGRWEIIQHNPTIVLDVAHNQAGIEQLINQIRHYSYQQLHIVFGMVKDKDSSQVLSLLPKEAIYYFTQANIPRALTTTELQQQALKYGLTGSTYEDVNRALHAAVSYAIHKDLIIVCGSVFLVAEVAR